MPKKVKVEKFYVNKLKLRTQQDVVNNYGILPNEYGVIHYYVGSVEVSYFELSKDLKEVKIIF